MLAEGRARRVDFYRGLALLFMFWDHIPGNIMGNLTLRNFGLSDAAEIFVFLSGYSAVVAYGRVMQRDSYPSACRRILFRSWKLYVMHIFLLVVLMGVVFVLNNYVETRDFIDEMHLGYFLSDTERVLVDALLLRFKPNLMDPLPLYIVLMLGLAVVLPLLLRRPLWVVGASFALYVLVLAFDWNLPGQTGEHWFFNPLAWQFLFVLGGAAAAMDLCSSTHPDPFPKVLHGAAVTYLLVSCVWALSWRWPELHALIISRDLGALIYPISKTNLSPLRLLHFVALAIVVATVLPVGAWLENRLGRFLRLLGRHALEVFCLSVVLSPIADALSAMADDIWSVQIVTALAGVGLMAALALALDWPQGQRRPTPLPPAAPI